MKCRVSSRPMGPASGLAAPRLSRRAANFAISRTIRIISKSAAAVVDDSAPLRFGHGLCYNIVRLLEHLFQHGGCAGVELVSLHGGDARINSLGVNLCNGDRLVVLSCLKAATELPTRFASVSTLNGVSEPRNLGSVALTSPREYAILSHSETGDCASCAVRREVRGESPDSASTALETEAWLTSAIRCAIIPTTGRADSPMLTAPVAVLMVSESFSFRVIS